MLISFEKCVTRCVNDAYEQSGGPHWEVPLGRRDSKTASFRKSNVDIPAPNSTIQTLVTKFSKQGLDEEDLVALSGKKLPQFSSKTCGCFKFYS